MSQTLRTVRKCESKRCGWRPLHGGDVFAALLAAMIIVMFTARASQAGTLSVVEAAAYPDPEYPLDPGYVTYCVKASTSEATCAAYLQQSTEYYPEEAGADATAGSSFGEISASASASTYRYTASSAFFWSEFSDYLLVTGGAGTGILRAKFDAEGWDAAYSLILGETRDDWFRVAYGDYGYEEGALRIIETPFIFGEPVRIGAQATGSAEGERAGDSSGAYLNLTGFEVRENYPRYGLVPGAVVTPLGDPDVNFFSKPAFVPEPASAVLLVGGFLTFSIFCPGLRRRGRAS